MSQTVSHHKHVEFVYSIVDEHGGVVEQVDLPVGYLHGAGHGLIEKVEAALEGHTDGDEISVSVSAREGFGPHRPELTFTDDLENVPPQFRRIGAEVEMQNDQGESKTFRVSRIEDGKLTVDGNHPFAGRDLTYRLRILTVRDATPKEIASHTPQAPPFH